MEMRRTNPGFIGKAKMNTIKITKALVGAFLACWTPYYVMCIW
jgi:gonadotropin-releasing hormone receptor